MLNIERSHWRTVENTLKWFRCHPCLQTPSYCIGFHSSIAIMWLIHKLQGLSENDSSSSCTIKVLKGVWNEKLSVQAYSNRDLFSIMLKYVGKHTYNSTIVTTQKTNKYRQWHVIVMLAYSLYIWKRFCGSWSRAPVSLHMKDLSVCTNILIEVETYFTAFTEMEMHHYQNFRATATWIPLAIGDVSSSYVDTSKDRKPITDNM